MAQSFIFVVKHDTTEGWLSRQDNLLLAGEIGFDDTLRRFKVGIGKTWTETPFVAPEVIDNLLSTDKLSALSANQGKVLDTKINTTSTTLTNNINNTKTELNTSINNTRTELTTLINNMQSDLEELIANGGGLNSWPPHDFRTYAVMNGEWIHLINGTTEIPEPALEEVNKFGEQAIDIFLPFKYAMNATNTAVKDNTGREYRYPFTNGKIIQVSMKATTPSGTKVNVLINNRNVLDTAQAVTTEWKDYACNKTIYLNEMIEISTTKSTEAVDLSVRILIQVGNAVIEFTGEADVVSNVYKLSAPNKQDKVYIPGVSEINHCRSGIIAKSITDDKWYGIGTFYIRDADNNLASNQTYTTPTEIVQFTNQNIQYINESSQNILCYMSDGSVRITGGYMVKSHSSSNNASPSITYQSPDIKTIDASSIPKFYAFNVPNSLASYVIFQDGSKCGMISNGSLDIITNTNNVFTSFDYKFNIFNPPNGTKIKQVICPVLQSKGFSYKYTTTSSCSSNCPSHRSSCPSYGCGGMQSCSGRTATCSCYSVSSSTSTSYTVNYTIYSNPLKTYILTQDGEIYYTKYDGTSSTFTQPSWRHLFVDMNNDELKVKRMFRNYLVTEDNKIYKIDYADNPTCTYITQFTQEILDISYTGNYIFCLTEGSDRNKLYIMSGTSATTLFNSTSTKYESFTEVLQNYHIDQFIPYDSSNIYCIARKLGDMVI